MKRLFPHVNLIFLSVSTMKETSAEHVLLQMAFFDRQSEETPTWDQLVTTYGVKKWQLRKAYKIWTHNYPKSQPESHNDINFVLPPNGRPLKLGTKHEKTIAEEIRIYANNCNPLRKQGVISLMQHYV